MKFDFEKFIHAANVDRITLANKLSCCYGTDVDTGKIQKQFIHFITWEQCEGYGSICTTEYVQLLLQSS